MKQKQLILNFSILTFILSSSSLSAQKYKEMMDDPSFTVQEIQKEAEIFFADKDKGRGSGYKQFKRWEYNALRNQDDQGYLKTTAFYVDELERYNKYRNNRRSVNLNDFWEELGPTYWNQTAGWNPGVGRLTSIAIDHKDTDHIIVGSNVGGVWKTENEGNSWTPLTDNLSNIYVYSLSIDLLDKNTYYWGSSRGFMFKSTDGGATWFTIGRAGSNGNVNKILIHPTNTSIVFASTERSGFYKSTDGGLNWTRIINDNRAQDIEFNPNDPDIMYFSGESVYRSEDLGENHTEITGFNTGAKMVAVTPANADRVYVLEENGGRFGGFYSSTDAGLTFTEKDHTDKNYFGYDSDADDNRGQAPRDMDVVVSTTDPEEVHIAGILTWRSTDGGDTFSITSQWVPGTAVRENIGYCHADVDIMEMINDKLYIGSDGGIFIADDIKNVNSDYYRDITTGLGIRAFYKIGISQTDPVIITGGSQDNGTSTYNPDEGWTDWLGADGMESFIDKDDTSTMYGTSQFGSLYKTTNGGNSRRGIGTPNNKEGNWITPFEQDPQASDVIYTGYNQVYKSEDGGETWVSISQTFSRNLDELKIAPSDNTVMYTSFRNELYKKEETGTDWTKLTIDTEVSSGNINSIAIHPTNPEKIAVATTGNRKVYVSNDGGLTWESYRKNLPNFSALALVWQDNAENGLYLGMNYGIYYIDDSLEEWENFSNNLPNVIVNELEINYADNKIYAGTYGRGCWVSPLKQETLSIGERSVVTDFKIYPNPAKNVLFVKTETNIKTSLRLFNNQGQLVYFAKDSDLSSDLEINTGSFAAGLYFLRISNQQGEITKKVILQ